MKTEKNCENCRNECGFKKTDKLDACDNWQQQQYCECDWMNMRKDSIELHWHEKQCWARFIHSSEPIHFCPNCGLPPEPPKLIEKTYKVGDELLMRDNSYWQICFADGKAYFNHHGIICSKYFGVNRIDKITKSEINKIPASLQTDSNGDFLVLPKESVDLDRLRQVLVNSAMDGKIFDRYSDKFIPLTVIYAILDDFKKEKVC
ncbi:MAG: hypothetical protein V1709_00900 [Planctomycetota bacterium]